MSAAGSVRDDREEFPGATTVAGILAAAALAGCRRVFLVGPKPSSSAWLDEPCGNGWEPAAHFYQLRDPCGRWTDTATGKVTEVRRAASWFGEGDYTASQARDAMALVQSLLRAETRARVGVSASPSGTGQSLWAATIKDGQLDEQTDRAVADLIRATSPQHREEVIGYCYDGCDQHNPHGGAAKLGTVRYVDGVFMYAACTRELGGKGRLFDSARLADAHLEAHPYGRARYEVIATIPDEWAAPGLLAVKHDNGRNWHYPSRPGLKLKTWADAAEVHLAMSNGWRVTPTAIIRYDENARPMDTFTAKILRMREAVAPAGNNVVHRLAAAAVRSMFIRAIGTFHSRGRERSQVVKLGDELPPDVTEWETRDNGDRVYTTISEPSGNAASFVRPELSSQVWARARVKVTAAMLTRPPGDVVAVWGDALYLASDPGWTGGEPGTFRVKGQADNVTRPRSISELLKLRETLEG